ncbi:MAG: alpha/beta hydrolase [Proteobacteria bacterium]|nr:alpha/beta hydrolase [Pseudomonadota bacterium]
MPRVESHSASIYYERHGEGPGLVFAHGAGGNTMIWWQQVPHFAERYSVVTFDHRCFGRSRCPSDDFHPKYFADDLVAVLDAAGIERAALVCQSMGGWTGVRMALDHPERVSCLALCGTPGGIFTPEIVAAAAKIATNAATGIRGNAALAPDYPSRQPEMTFLYDQISAHNTGFDPPVHFPRMLDVRARVLPEALAGWTLPTLVVAGSEDQLFPLDTLRAVAALLPGAELVEFPGAGHSTYFEQPDRFNTVIGEFVAKHSPQ